jgi:CRISPR/Cas system endoribonuclease Cas6 (RAMP superfamily)
MGQDEQPVAETADPRGERVVLLPSVWTGKIVRDHPEVAAHLTAVLHVVATPDHVTPDPQIAARTRYYGHGVGPSRWLLVVVSYEQDPARIVSAFANRKDPRSWSA